MPLLVNVRYERMAQLLAEGKPQVEAYANSGFATKYPDRGATQLLKKHPEIRARAEELRLDADRRSREVLNRAMDQSAVSKAYVLRRLHEIAERCMQHYPVLDNNGQQVFVDTPDGKLMPAFTFDAKGARGALHLIGLEMGMFVHRVRFEKSPLDDLPAEVLQQMLQNLVDMKQGRILEHKSNANGADKPSDKPALVDRGASG
jgi:hypothetical protein